MYLIGIPNGISNILTLWCIGPDIELSVCILGANARGIGVQRSYGEGRDEEKEERERFMVKRSNAYLSCGCFKIKLNRTTSRTTASARQEKGMKNTQREILQVAL
eukprot:TRINITY_DN33214_c0_g1_i1.p1 TRINITY_DN33214_c0_g1~~TRINITY_DN33214_c0_g1_i1.p1  ORF type:complete len:105 (+),score=19.39 TRINITY_DN33214_c0_g1_i1:132-446(+)